MRTSVHVDARVRLCLVPRSLQDPVWLVGRVVVEGGGGEGEQQVLLEGGLEASEGERVRLDLSALTSATQGPACRVFPGQVRAASAPYISAALPALTAASLLLRLCCCTCACACCCACTAVPATCVRVCVCVRVHVHAKQGCREPCHLCRCGGRAVQPGCEKSAAALGLSRACSQAHLPLLVRSGRRARLGCTWGLHRIIRRGV